jgi:hypothetical protein
MNLPQTKWPNFIRNTAGRSGSIKVYRAASANRPKAWAGLLKPLPAKLFPEFGKEL